MATPFAQTIVRDTGTRANSGTLGANWTALSDATDTQVLGITSNHMQVQVTGGRAASFWNANNFQPNQYSQAFVSTSALGTNNHIAGVTVLSSAGNYYAFTWNMTNNLAADLQLFKVVAGTFTDLGGTPGSNPAVSGSLFRLEATVAAGTTTLNAYIDGNLIFGPVTDTSLVTGAPGITGFMAAASPTAYCTNWEGGSLLWTRKGTVIAIGSNGGSQEPSVIYEASPKILSANADGKIWKIWFTNGWNTGTINIYYAESADAITWSQYSSNPVITDTNPGHFYVLHVGSTYYAYVIGDVLTNGTPIDQWTSSDGLAWTKAHAAVLSVGAGGSWDALSIANPYVWIVAGTWYMLYVGRSVVNYSVGLATSPDGITWTKYVSNPVITSSGSPANGKNVIINGGNYYMWGFASASSNIPTDHYLYTSADLHSWTTNSKDPVYQRVLLNEGVNLATGQVADPCMVELSGTTYMFYDTITTQASGKIHINMASCSYTMLQVMGMVAGTWIIAGNCGVPGATVTATGTATVAVSADANGNYVIPITTAGAYTITPSGGTFTPTTSSQTITTADITGVNFTASVGNAGSLSLRRRKRRDVIS